MTKNQLSPDYPTSGMILLGALIEKVSGMTYQNYIANTIFKPLKMNNTSFVNGFQESEQLDSNGAYTKGYTKNEKGEIVKIPYSEDEKQFIPLSAGGVWSCASDLFKFDKGIYKYEILKKEFVDLMTQKYTYGRFYNLIL